jgi:DNA-binding MarR family transcriptional regulator
MKTRINPINYMFSHLEELHDKSRFKDLLSEIHKLENKVNIPRTEHIVYEFYKTRLAFFLEGEIVALEEIEKIIKGSKKRDYLLLQIDALLIKSDLLRLSGDRPNAENIIKEVQSILDSLENEIDDVSKKLITARYKIVKGSWFLYEGKQNHAIGYYNDGIKILTNISINSSYSTVLDYQEKGRFLLADAYHKLAVAYNSTGEINKVENYTMKSIEIKKEINDTIGLAVSWMLLGNICRLKNEFNEAEEWFKKCLITFDEADYHRAKAYTLSYLISIHIDPKNSRANIDTAYDYFKKFNDILTVTKSENIIKIYQQALANLLSEGSRYRDKVEAIKLYEDIIADSRTEERMRIRCMISLCEIYLEEYQVYSNPKVLAEIVLLTDTVLKLAEKQNAPRWMIRALSLKAEIELLDLNYDKYVEIQHKAQKIAESEDIIEYKNLLKQRVKPGTFNFFREIFNDSSEGLTKNHLRILLFIVKTGSYDYKSLRESMAMSRSTFFRAVKQLREMKLISIDTSLEDARKRTVILEDEGKEIMELFRIVTSGKVMV